jgi:hypothetical protein
MPEHLRFVSGLVWLVLLLSLALAALRASYTVRDGRAVVLGGLALILVLTAVAGASLIGGWS